MRKTMMAIIMTVLITLQPITAKAETTINMGECKITWYCPCQICSDGYGRVTATTHKTGRLAEAGRTVAVDPTVFPLETEIKIGDEIYVTEDVGGGVVGDHIDIFVDSHEEIPKHGVEYRNVWILR